MSMVQVTAEYDEGCESVCEKESNELRALFTLKNNVDGSNDRNDLSTSVTNVRCDIMFANLVSHGL